MALNLYEAHLRKFIGSPAQVLSLRSFLPISGDPYSTLNHGLDNPIDTLSCPFDCCQKRLDQNYFPDCEINNTSIRMRLGFGIESQQGNNSNQPNSRERNSGERPLSNNPNYLQNVPRRTLFEGRVPGPMRFEELINNSSPKEIGGEEGDQQILLMERDNLKLTFHKGQSAGDQGQNSGNSGTSPSPRVYGDQMYMNLQNFQNFQQMQNRFGHQMPFHPLTTVTDTELDLEKRRNNSRPNSPQQSGPPWTPNFTTPASRKEYKDTGVIKDTRVQKQGQNSPQNSPRVSVWCQGQMEVTQMYNFALSPTQLQQMRRGQQIQGQGSQECKIPVMEIKPRNSTSNSSTQEFIDQQLNSHLKAFKYLKPGPGPGPGQSSNATVTKMGQGGVKMPNVSTTPKLKKTRPQELISNLEQYEKLRKYWDYQHQLLTQNPSVPIGPGPSTPDNYRYPQYNPQYNYESHNVPYGNYGQGKPYQQQQQAYQPHPGQGKYPGSQRSNIQENYPHFHHYYNYTHKDYQCNYDSNPNSIQEQSILSLNPRKRAVEAPKSPDSLALEVEVQRRKLSIYENMEREKASSVPMPIQNQKDPESQIRNDTPELQMWSQNASKSGIGGKDNQATISRESRPKTAQLKMNVPNFRNCSFEEFRNFRQFCTQKKGEDGKEIAKPTDLSIRRNPPDKEPEPEGRLIIERVQGSSSQSLQEKVTISDPKEPRPRAKSVGLMGGSGNSNSNSSVSKDVTGYDHVVLLDKRVMTYMCKRCLETLKSEQDIRNHLFCKMLINSIQCHVCRNLFTTQEYPEHLKGHGVRAVST